jgi:biotin carboxyl carrier protein
MIKKVRVTVDGKPFDVTVEIPDDAPPPVSPSPAASHPAPPPSPASSHPAPGEIPSPLAGHVVGVSVTVGQRVKQGESLVTVEAMKMNTFVLAPADGKVAAINVKVGDAVSEGQPLIRIE